MCSTMYWKEDSNRTYCLIEAVELSLEIFGMGVGNCIVSISKWKDERTYVSPLEEAPGNRIKWHHQLVGVPGKTRQGLPAYHEVPWFIPNCNRNVS